MKPASKQDSQFRVLFTRSLVLTIDKSINFLFAKSCDRLDKLKFYSVFGSGFLIDHALSLCFCCHLIYICYVLIYLYVGCFGCTLDDFCIELYCNRQLNLVLVDFTAMIRVLCMEVLKNLVKNNRR